MTYEIIYSQDAVNDLKKLSKEIQRRVLSALERCRIRPYPHIKKLVGNPYFRLRVGDYRVILDIQESRLVIFVIEIDHRKKIYK